ncbi:MAG: MarR family transcriptional regulator [Planctomycetes bacterium]|nr:MarR family transcriptional regulator [Planctomycetota bacterium]
MARSLRDEILQSQPFRSLETEVSLNLLRSADWIASGQNALLKPHGLSHSTYNVLRILRGAGADGLPSQQIAVRMITRVPDVTRLVDRLEQRGLVARERGAADRRVVRVRILPAGLRVLADLDEPIDALARRQLTHLGERRLTQLNRALVALRSSPAGADAPVRGRAARGAD